jgi:O-antigen/teichoic acid export membrane protein
MGPLLTVIVLVLLLASAAFQLQGRRRVACWLLAVFPGFACIAYLRDLAQGSQRMGLAALQSDQKQFGAALVLLAISVVAALRPQWRWLFWLEWIFNAIACGVLVYLVFFWKAFS